MGGAVLSGKHSGFETYHVVDKQIDAFTCGELAFGVLFSIFLRRRLIQPYGGLRPIVRDAAPWFWVISHDLS